MIKKRTRMLAIVLIALSCLWAIGSLIKFSQNSIDFISFFAYMLFSLYIGMTSFGLLKGSKLAWWLLFIFTLVIILVSFILVGLGVLTGAIITLKINLLLFLFLALIPTGFWAVVLVLLLTDNPRYWEQNIKR